MTTENDSDQRRRLIAQPLDTFRGAVLTVADLADFIRDNSERIQNIQEAFVREARRSHSEHLEDQHRRAAKLYHDHVRAVMKEREELPEEEFPELVATLQSALRAAILELTGQEGDYWRYWQIWQDVRDRPQELYLLTKALFISLVSDFEILVANVIKVQLKMRPEMLNISEQKYSLADMEDFATLDDFKDHCAENYADSLMRGGFDEWIKWFGNRHKLAIPGVTVDNDALVELFQRRHLLVHAGGVVNDQYLQRCGGAVTKGEELKVGRKYLLRAADTLLAAGIKLMGSAALAVADTQTKEFVGHSLSRHLAYELLKARRYGVVREVLEWYEPRIDNETDRLTSKVNLWIALKHSAGGLEAIRGDIEVWDTSVLADRFKLAKHALLGEDFEAYALVSKLIASSEITMQDWNEWPLLQSVRQFEAESGLGPLSDSLSAVSSDGKDRIRDLSEEAPDEPNGPEGPKGTEGPEGGPEAA